MRYTLPDPGPVSVVIYDTIGEELFNEELELDEFGAFHGEIELAEVFRDLHENFRKATKPLNHIADYYLQYKRDALFH